MGDRVFVSSRLTWLPGRFAIGRLDPGAAVPPWAWAGGFVSFARTPSELSVVCDEAVIPKGMNFEAGWHALIVDGPMDLSTVDVLASITGPLANAGVALFAVSTFETDYLLVREGEAAIAATALREAGHEVGEEAGV